MFYKCIFSFIVDMGYPSHCLPFSRHHLPIYLKGSIVLYKSDKFIFCHSNLNMAMSVFQNLLGIKVTFFSGPHVMSLVLLRWNKSLWSVKNSHVTPNNQSECFVYDIGSWINLSSIKFSFVLLVPFGNIISDSKWSSRQDLL